MLEIWKHHTIRITKLRHVLGFDTAVESIFNPGMTLANKTI